jgi:hypothetical protein
MCNWVASWYCNQSLPMYELSTLIVVAYFPTHLPIYRPYLLQNGLPRLD